MKKWRIAASDHGHIRVAAILVVIWALLPLACGGGGSSKPDPGSCFAKPQFLRTSRKVLVSGGTQFPNDVFGSVVRINPAGEGGLPQTGVVIGRGVILTSAHGWNQGARLFVETPGANGVAFPGRILTRLPARMEVPPAGYDVGLVFVNRENIPTDPNTLRPESRVLTNW